MLTNVLCLSVLTLIVLCAAQDIEPEFLPQPSKKQPTTTEVATTTSETTTAVTLTELSTMTEPTEITTETQQTTTSDEALTEDSTRTETMELTSTIQPTEITTETKIVFTEPTTNVINDTVTEILTSVTSPETTTTKALPITTIKYPKIPITTSVSTLTPTKRPLGCHFTRRHGKPHYCWKEKRFRVPVFCVYCCNVLSHEICYYVNQSFCCKTRLPLLPRVGIKF